VKRSRGLDSEPIGRAHANPLFDTREYEIEFVEGTRDKYQANVIAKNMFAQVDSEGNQFLLSSYNRKSLTTRRTTARFRYQMERSKARTVNRSPARLQPEDGPFWFNGRTDPSAGRN
jgi:hypothetical protein